MYFLIDIDFLTTCPGTYYFLLANQIVHLTIHYPIKIFAIKVKVKLKFVESISVFFCQVYVDSKLKLRMK